MSTEALVAALENMDGLKKEIKIHDHPHMRETPIAMDGMEPDKKSFDQLMKQNQPNQAQAVDPHRANLPAPMQEAARIGGVLRVEDAKQLGAVLDRFKKSQADRWNEMKKRLEQNPSIQISPNVSRHLEMKMGSIDEQFGRLSKDLGIPGTDPNQSIGFRESLGVTTETLAKPLETFFNFVARGERQLYGLQNDIDAIFSKGEQLIDPGVMLKLQLKMTHVSQQLELFTSILNKGLESSKTVFNTQI
jgi:hypothetical protein